MKKLMTFTVITALTVSGLHGCATSTKEETGALTGAALGAAVGSTFGRGSGKALAIFIGAVAGSAIGSTMGRYMDEQDRIRTSMILESNRTNQASSWKNPDTGNNYTVTPTKTYEVAEGPCREFTLDANVGGKPQELYGTACRQQDGSWKMVQ
jgi:surface antigen